MLKGLIERVSSAVNMDSLEDKITAQNHIKIEQNLLLNNIQKALTKKFALTNSNKDNVYGFKDEDTIRDAMKQSIKLTLDKYNVEIPNKSTA